MADPTRRRNKSAPRDERRCQLCGRAGRGAHLTTLSSLRPALVEYLTRAHPGLSIDSGWICHACLNSARFDHLLVRLEEERGELSAMETEVAQRAATHGTIAVDLERQFKKSATPGQRIADTVARVGGSWPFVLGFGVVLFCWMALNTLMLGARAFDPYPYILLNLVLSCLAAVQAPIIMMSQNRQVARDRLQADNDFRINLKAEIEIATLHEKVDHLLHAQWEQMVELQETQLELLTELAAARDRGR